MTRFLRTLPIAVLLVLVACTSPSATPTLEPTPSPAAAPTASPTPGPEATESASPEESPSSSPIGGEPGGFAFQSSAEADELFADRFTCQNLDAGYQISFPSAWNANAEFGDVPPCSWFAATEYETGAPGTVPDEVAIEIFVVDGERAYGDAELSDREEGFIGVTQSAYRVTVDDGEETGYEYVIQLGTSFEDGPNLVARTASEMGGDFDLNRAVLDRMMATMEFIGVIQ